jgi:hypothetical protein
MSACLECKGAGKHVGFACPGFRRIEHPCEPCGGTGVAPDWQAEAVAYGFRLRQARLTRNISVREEAGRLDVSPAMLGDVEQGRLPIYELPLALRDVR